MEDKIGPFALQQDIAFEDVRKSIVLILKPYAAEDSQKAATISAAALNSLYGSSGIVFRIERRPIVFDEVD